MTRQTVFTNARLVLDDEVVEGTLVVADGRIDAIDTVATAAPGALDLEGDYLIPGLVELHTDHVEAHAFPRPNVRWPIMPAVLAHDAAIASAGITTVFDAIAVGHDAGKEYRRDLCDDVLAALDRAARDDQLRAEHRVHLRCEITVEGMEEQFVRNREDPRVGLVSIMDHTPGQRQFVDLGKYREYYGGKYGVDGADLERHIAESRARQATYADPNRSCVIDWCRSRGLPLASHDDASADDVAEAAAAGAILAEFPTTEDAARAAREHGMRNILGAPNMVRGGSHSGNVGATELAERGLIDVFSSDYVPASLLHAGWLLIGRGYGLPQAIATISAAPARLLGLEDRGRLAPALRADLVRVRAADHGPVVRGVWREGCAIA